MKTPGGALPSLRAMEAGQPRTGPLVVGYDGRDESRLALDEGIREARLRGVGLVVVVVAGLPYQSVDPFNAGAVDVGFVAPVPAEGPLEIQPIVAEAREALAAAGAEGIVEWAQGDPTSEILRVADDRQASAIVVGTHHHSAIGRLFGTDVAADLARSAGCEVIVVH
jgi:nucleotide-binding universal stress UspA family protein